MFIPKFILLCTGGEPININPILATTVAEFSSPETEYNNLTTGEHTSSCKYLHKVCYTTRAHYRRGRTCNNSHSIHTGQNALNISL